MPDEIENAQIKDTFFGVGDNGILTFYLTCEGENGTQAFGGYYLDLYDGPGARVGNPGGLILMRTIIETLGVSSWEKLRGQYCRVKRENGIIRAVGHWTRNKWADTRENLYPSTT